MDRRSRETASTYINNLLLSRGLLRNGTPIEFARPEHAEGGLDATMSQVMNLVHDMILRRDRESDTLSNLSQTVSSLRSQKTVQMQQIGRLESQKAASDRQLAIASAQERSGQATLRGAETRNRALREDMIRLKGTVAQVRAQCASDVRRRDGEIARLKKHLDGRRVRDGVTNGHIGVVLVTQGNHKGSNGLRVGGDSACTADGGPESLKQDTTEFLTRLSQGLSDENDALVGLVRGTLTTLRSLQGLAEDDGREWGSENGPTQIDSTHIFMDGAPSHESLAVSTDEVLEHLRGLLTNPSFVPLEEVVTREEEIQRLREGWERMAVRWKEAVALMGSWKKRMVNEGDTINLEDLKTGLKLGSGIPTAQEARISPLRVRDAAIDRDDSNLSEIAAQGRKGGPIEEDTVTDWHQKLGALAGSTERALRETSANPKTAPSATISIPEEETLTASEDESSLLDLSREKRISATAMKPSVSRIPLQTAQLKISATTVQQKLAIVQTEAEEARKRVEAKPNRRGSLKAGKRRKPKGSRRRSTLSPEELENLMGGS